MKIVSFLSFLFLSQIYFAQNVILSKIVKSNSNADKIFYKIDKGNTAAEYLGELEVQGFSDDDVKVFGMIYKKAKEIGANAFSYEPFQTIDDVAPQFNAANYKLNLYHLPAADFPKEDNVIYLIASPYKSQKISVDRKNVVFEPRTFTKRTLAAGEIYNISTRKIFGSSVQLSGEENQPVQYFQFSAFSVNSNPYGTAGINLKSGDITRLERSYGQFLTMIYEEVK